MNVNVNYTQKTFTSMVNVSQNVFTFISNFTQKVVSSYFERGEEVLSVNVTYEDENELILEDEYND